LTAKSDIKLNMLTRFFISVLFILEKLVFSKNYSANIHTFLEPEKLFMKKV